MIAMTLEQLLLLLGIVIDDTRMSRTVEDFMAVLCGEVVNTLIDIFIETKDPLKVESIDTISFFIHLVLLAIEIIHIYNYLKNMVNM